MRAPTPPTDSPGSSNLLNVDIDPKASFPSSLHKMLTEIDEQQNMQHFQKIISWQSHGMAFKIHDRQGFIDKIMPIWFSRLKYSSWVRQCNLFGFKRIQMDGRDKGALYHCENNFIRGMPELAANIAKVKKSKQPQPTVEKEPNFERMEYIRIGMPVNQVLQRSSFASLEEAKQPEYMQQQVSVSSDPLLASATLSAASNQLGPTSLARSNTDGSLRDMLLPILNTNDGESSSSPNNIMASATPLASSSSQPFPMATSTAQFDPFETIWNNLGESIQSTSHHNERLSMPLAAAMASSNSATAALGAAADSLHQSLFRSAFQEDTTTSTPAMDVEPLRVFPPFHEHADICHASPSSNSSDEQKKRPSKTARSA